MFPSFCLVNRKNPVQCVLEIFSSKIVSFIEAAALPCRAPVILAIHLIEETQAYGHSVVLLRPQTQKCEVQVPAFPLVALVSPLDFLFSINVGLPLPPSQPGSEPLRLLCHLTSYCSVSSLKHMAHWP